MAMTWVCQFLSCPNSISRWPKRLPGSAGVSPANLAANTTSARTATAPSSLHVTLVQAWMANSVGVARGTVAMAGDSSRRKGQKSKKCPMRCNESPDSLHGFGQKSKKCPMRCNESTDSLHDQGRNTAKMCCVCNACNESTNSLHDQGRNTAKMCCVCNACNESTNSVHGPVKNGQIVARRAHNPAILCTGRAKIVKMAHAISI
jgi:hypothetical protein